MKFSRNKCVVSWLIASVGYSLLFIAYGWTLSLAILCIHLAIILEVFFVVEVIVDGKD